MDVVMDEAVIHSAPNNDVLGDSVTIPGTDVEVKATFAIALLRQRIITGPQAHPVAQNPRVNSRKISPNLFEPQGTNRKGGSSGESK